ncbi:MAG: beta-phosphoglucomutase [Anaerolineaceae bacterium]|nr:MAG: beta-phosphoglucomutase [Anaerolineaceae bacterium]
MLSALIFDLDGVITAASAEFHYLSWRRLADEEGIAFTRADGEHLRGINRAESLTRFLNGHTVTATQRQDYLQRKQRYYLELLQQMTAADRLPGVAALLDQARSAGVKLAVASASRNVRAVLQKLQLDDYFDVIGDPSCVVNPKPAPDIFLWTAGYLRVSVREVVVLEDSAESVRTAIDAGFRTVGVGVASADLMVYDLSDINLDRLAALCVPVER